MSTGNALQIIKNIFQYLIYLNGEEEEKEEEENDSVSIIDDKERIIFGL